MKRPPAPSTPRRRAVADSQANETRERLLNAATQVLSAKGPAGFKVTEVAALAGVNVALISYHFGGRDALIDQVLQHAGRQVAEARAAALAALQQRGDEPTTEEVVRTWLRPAFEAICEPDTGVLMAHLTQMLFASDVGEERKLAVLGAATGPNADLLDMLAVRLPHLTRRTLAWRLLQSVACYSFAFGSIPMRWAERTVLVGAPNDPEEPYEELVAFVVAGFSAAAPDHRRRPAATGRKRPPSRSAAPGPARPPRK